MTSTYSPEIEAMEVSDWNAEQAELEAMRRDEIRHDPDDYPFDTDDIDWSEPVPDDHEYCD